MGSDRWRRVWKRNITNTWRLVMTTNANTALAAIALVHGGFVDGSGWEDVYRILKKDGYRVSIVQNPTTSLADDVAATKRVIAEQQGPVILVGHSYGRLVASGHRRGPNGGWAALVNGLLP